MNKDEALKVIFKCAKIYKDTLNNKVFLFISYDKNRYSYIETLFQNSNFLHLTGISLSNKIKPKEFFKRCVNKRLSINDFNFKSDGTTQLKLEVLPRLMNISSCSKMIGDFSASRVKLYVDKIAGNDKACIGFKKDGNYYYPATALKEDSRDLIINQERIIAIYRKEFNEHLYINNTYIAKGINIEEINLPKNILDKIDSSLSVNEEEEVAVGQTIN